GAAKRAVHRLGPDSALAGHDGIKALESLRIVRVSKRARGPADRRAAAARARRREKHGVKVLEVVFLEHALNKHRSDHATPSDKTYAHHLPFLIGYHRSCRGPCFGRLQLS